MGSFLQVLKNLGPVRLAAMAGVAMGIIAFFIFLTARLASPQLALLYGELDSQDAGGIIAKLEAQKIPFEIRGAGNEIYVPSDQVAKLRITMAEQGLPNGGSSVGYEIFDKGQGLGTTNFEQNINLVRALEGELERTIRSINGVKQARVHLVMPQRELFSREEQSASASIVVRTSGPGRLPKEEVLAIQHLVSTSVPKLKPERITIIDDHGNLLARGGDAQGLLTSQNAEEMKLQEETRLQQQIQDLLERSVGLGGVRAEVSADMDFNHVVTNSEIYNPNNQDQVVRSVQTVNDNSTNNEGEGQTPVTVASNLPDANAGTGGGNNHSAATQQHNEETTNYEVSKSVQNSIKDVGTIKRLSVAVLVDGTYKTVNGQRVYTPRSQDEMDKLQTLVKSAIGFDATRGDAVQVINLQFANLDELLPKEENATFFGLEKSDLFRMAEILVLSIVAILVILLVVRPLLSRAFESLPAAMEGGRRLLTDQSIAGLAPALAAPGAVPIPAPQTAMVRAIEAPDELIDIDRVEGRVKASSVKKIGEIVDKHPEEALSILRNWMYQEA